MRCFVRRGLSRSARRCVLIEILTVCTGNICRSPLAAVVLQTRLADLDARVTSAGTRGLDDAAMTAEAQTLAVALGVPPEVAAAHRSRYLLELHLLTPDLILTMTREHRRMVAELAPARLRTSFTVREFARLAAGVSDDDLRSAADEAGADAAARMRAAAALVSTRRGIAPAPADPTDDDVIDPYGRPWKVYQESAAQLAPALAEVIRVARLAAGPSPALGR
ncbi:low molecular weight phosphatase family protein [Microbacterium horticulturae]|uniref:protein-tyrosine-phosphatase n=1 Tax=Microbacterium horticulturae TaxID=3028316 RepID=A0ABY8BZX5_9MICO|nr:low molecular weight phosphatase family protein [Microbacterium sp. KACC 23027]WEG08158.1 low molecular weight phosphatase family protein [Microbacterium sp. KACC 23027]